tara:strand:- start:4357 stop:4632 length:276 start_codon:yes stop_codon:yes gene_type:complete
MAFDQYSALHGQYGDAAVPAKNQDNAGRDIQDDPFYKEKPGIIPGLAKLAGGASSIMDLFFNAKKLAKADDARSAQSALDNIASMDKSKTV